ncbi:hypothetical protein EYF80_057176 [Liparis tanakae]|uniref:Uncharacterized protein n=1 Tax=Liparis tanakae TaxID=230148 RepID=A0A4Z2EWP0_9TELE|nr:hypothetical protein EYF80_057176 [Liparis tanakae]
MSVVSARTASHSRMKPQRPETRDQRPETRDQRPETRDQRPETRDPNSIMSESAEALAADLTNRAICRSVDIEITNLTNVYCLTNPKYVIHVYILYYSYMFIYNVIVTCLYIIL